MKCWLARNFPYLVPKKWLDDCAYKEIYKHMSPEEWKAKKQKMLKEIIQNVQKSNNSRQRV